MAPELTRVHQRYLSLTQPRPSLARSDEVTILPKRLHFTSGVRKVILDELYATGSLRGGPLFGHTLDSVITVVAAPPSGYRVLDPMLFTDPLLCDARYLLGYIDALNHTSDVRIDWVGTWVMSPNSVLGSLENELAWLRRGRETDLVSARHCLCALGWEDGTLSARAYTWGPFNDDMDILSTDL
jgi:hypothetical protein